MVSDTKELNARVARALMSLIRLTEALEDDGCILSPQGSVSNILLPEIFATAAAKAGQSGCDEQAVIRTVSALIDIKDQRNREAFTGRVIEMSEKFMTEDEEPGCLQILKEFDRQVLERDKDFYRKRGGSNTGLADMYQETVNVLTLIMLKG